MNWLVAGSEVVAGVALFAGLVVAIALLRPPRGTLEERAVVRFPGAWIVVGLPLTFAFGVSVALIVIGAGILR
jgi:hypothetical protein